MATVVSSDPVNAGEEQDIWKTAWDTLNIEDQEQYKDTPLGRLELLKNIQEATEDKKQLCVRKGWRLYQKASGEEVKLRHVLEKISVWVKDLIKIADVPVSLDQSGHAALPWAIVKYCLTTFAFSDIELFSSLAEGIEIVARLITRYAIIENLYLSRDCQATPELRKSITVLYAAILNYLAKVKSYFAANRWRRLFKSLLDAMRKQYDELRAKISENEVEKWIAVVDAELQRKLTQSALDHHQDLMNALLRLNLPVMQTNDQIAALQDHFNREERIKIFHWLSTTEYRSHHDDLSTDLLPHSGQWLLQSPQFIEWGQSSTSSILWVHGIPGSGKTRLMSTIIARMLDSEPLSQMSSVAFFYCARSTAEPERAKPAEIMGALLRQLASSTSDAPVKEAVATEYGLRQSKAEKDGSTLKKLTVKDCTRLILEITKASPATIILDALDECDDDTRYELLDALDELISESAEVVKILVSSRDDADIKIHLEKSKEVTVSADNNSGDVSRFVSFEVDRLIAKKLLLDGRVSFKLRKKITKILIDGAHGMFRWVEMSLETLRRIKFEKDFRETLGQLPPKLADLYSTVYTEIEESKPFGRDVAFKTFTWLLCAQRLLTVEELVAAIPIFYDIEDGSSSESDDLSSIEDPCPDSDGTSRINDSLLRVPNVDSTTDEGPSPVEDILRLCRNFVVLDSEQHVFRFAHQSVREYLEEREEYDSRKVHAYAAGRCFDVYSTDSELKSLENPTTLEQVKSEMQQPNAFRPYARLYWPVHYRPVEKYKCEDLHRSLRRFVKQEPNPDLVRLQQASDYVSQSLEHYNHLWDFSKADANIPPPFLRWASDFHCTFEKRYHYFWQLNDDIKTGDNDRLGYTLCNASAKPYSVLNAACAFGFESFLTDCELSSIDVNLRLCLCPGAEISTFLHIAASEGHNHMVRRLLDKGADVNAMGVDSRGRSKHASVLQSAVQESHEQVVQILLEHGADVNATASDGSNALYDASLWSFKSIVQLLLRNGADANAQGLDFHSALQAASTSGDIQVVQTLMDNKADINAQGGHFGCALQAAAACGHSQIVQHLLDNGADINAQSGVYGSALQAAAASGDSQIVQYLLNNGADINAQGGYFGCVLQAAAAEGHSQIVQYLLNNGADINAQGGRYGCVLQAAAASGDSQIVQYLLNNGADINAQGGYYGCVLQAAAARGHSQIVQYLLNNGADINAQGGNYGCVLQAAAVSGDSQIVQYLLNNGADINAQGGVYGCALQAAAASGHSQIVQHLLDNGADINAQGGRYGCALQAAIERGHDEVAQLLRRYGAHEPVDDENDHDGDEDWETTSEESA